MPPPTRPRRAAAKAQAIAERNEDDLSQSRSGHSQHRDGSHFGNAQNERSTSGSSGWT